MSVVSKLTNNGIEFSDRDLVHVIQILKSCDNLDKKEDEIVEFYKKKILILHTAEGKRIYAKTLMQKRYLELLESSSILFVTGSAGTGKTYLAVAYAVSKLKKNLKSLTYTPKNINDTRKSIKDNLKIIDETLRQEVKDYSINYGYNYFPEKVYKGIYYEEGEYESLVITLGEGIGNNFWCVLFPPLCLIDEEQDEVEYTTFIKELIDKYF